MSNVLWIDENVDSYINQLYSKGLGSIKSLKVKLFKKVLEALSYLKTIKFEKTTIIVSGRLYSEFVLAFKNNIINMYVIPIIIVFTRNKDTFIKYNPDYYDSNNKFYNFGGIAILFDEILKFLNKEEKNVEEKNIEKNNAINNNKNKRFSTESDNPLYLVKAIEYRTKDKLEDIQLTFEYIDDKLKLIFILFFKSLMEYASNQDINKYNTLLYNTYSKENSAVEELLGQITSVPDIPIEILSKYYARLYSNYCKFHSDLNKDLRLNKKSRHLPFIKALYEGVRLKSLPLCNNKELYRGGHLSIEELNKINLYSKNKIDYLPGLIVFSKSFLSFTKDRGVAECFISSNSEKKDLYKVIFILEKDDNMGSDLATHGDIEEVSFLPLEKEVLFFPFSTFKIKDKREVNIGKENGYEIKLSYLGKYFENIKNDKNIITKENKIPDSEFKRQFDEFGFTQQDKIKNINSKKYYIIYIIYMKTKLIIL